MKHPEVLAFLFLWAWIAEECHTQQERFAGPFRLIFNQYGQCDETGTRQIYTNSTRINKLSRTKYIYATNMTTEIVISDAMVGSYALGSLDIKSIQIGQSLPSFPYGKYRSDVSSWINSTLVGCIRCYFDAVPTKRSQPKKISRQSS